MEKNTGVDYWSPSQHQCVCAHIHKYIHIYLYRTYIKRKEISTHGTNMYDHKVILLNKTNSSQRNKVIVHLVHLLETASRNGGFLMLAVVGAGNFCVTEFWVGVMEKIW